jgi:hypothetical protein
VVIRVLEHGRAKQVQRAAGMLVGLLKFKRQLDLGRLETLRMNGVVPLCMNQCWPHQPMPRPQFPHGPSPWLVLVAVGFASVTASAMPREIRSNPR